MKCAGCGESGRRFWGRPPTRETCIDGRRVLPWSATTSQGPSNLEPGFHAESGHTWAGHEPSNLGFELVGSCPAGTCSPRQGLGGNVLSPSVTFLSQSSGRKTDWHVDVAHRFLGVRKCSALFYSVTCKPQ
ncbi:hypothetical protein HPB50_009184 [Hyalomma asiaticum]|uniref:Uncharacterized protein n=1 Tax=Hyalomma asiaticum TaxID=266040 RepID=A0ACB7RR28_HYAAI|nr:hypothetical protein HPB50_009184 [Hyalomma asiaticum]